MGIKSNNLAAIYHDFFSRSGTDAVNPYVPPPPLFVEDVFSTYLYTGNSSTRTITNGIDLAGEGGLVWVRWRSGPNYTFRDHYLFDTARGQEQALRTNQTGGNLNVTNSLTQFNNDGFYFNGGNSGLINWSGENYTSWTFRKAPGFFDVVTYTGTGASGSPRTVSHNLGSVPGMIVVKKTSGTADDWMVYHRSLGSTKGIKLNRTNEAYTAGDWGNTTPTSSEFYVNANDGAFNESGQTYVAYLFAHDEQIFGESGSESIIKCGSYTGSTTASIPIDLGWEPQWVLIKQATGSTTVYSNWAIFDNMRGIVTGSNDTVLAANLSAAEGADPPATGDFLELTPTGFIVDPGLNRWQLVNANATSDYVYIAIRRGPMKTPTDATDVFATDDGNGSASGPAFDSNFPVDLGWYTRPANADGMRWEPRLTGGKYMTSSSTASELGPDSWAGFDDNLGWGLNFGSNYRSWMFRRAPGFFDVVAYEGTGGNTTNNVNHNLDVAPEMIIVKNRDGISAWPVYHAAVGLSRSARLNSDTMDENASNYWSSAPTSTQFYPYGSDTNNTASWIAYLFATLPGISKVGSYTGTGTTLNIDCGFTSGARFVLIKRTDTSITGQTPPTGYNTNWYVWDTARGIVAGNDPYLTLNTTDAEDTGTDFIDPYSAGFTVTSTAPAALNASGGTYIFLAIA